MRIQCPSCASVVPARANDYGEMACPRCGTVLLAIPPVRQADVEQFTDPGVADDVAAFLPRPRLAPAIVTGVVVVVTALVGAGIFVWANEAKKRPPAKPVAAQKADGASGQNSPAQGNGTATANAIFASVAFWFVFGTILAIVLLALWILMLIWVARDAKQRMGESGGVWVFLVLFTGWVGLLVYVAARPHGPLIPCANCGNLRMAYAKICPHCTQRLGRPADL